MGFLGGSRNKPVPLTERELNNIVNRVDEATETPSSRQYLNQARRLESMMDLLMISQELSKRLTMKKILLKFPLVFLGNPLQ